MAEEEGEEEQPCQSLRGAGGEMLLVVVLLGVPDRLVVELARVDRLRGGPPFLRIALRAPC
eukprot:4881190-Pyramimonas_sp.AAC.1